MPDVTYDPVVAGVSREFIAAAEAARNRLRSQTYDPEMALAAWSVPVFLQTRPDAAQEIAGGCIHCTYLGLWARDWPGLPYAPHGNIFMFEDGIRKQALALPSQVYDTLEHELGHALQRDHVLEHLRSIQSAGMTVNDWARRAQAAPCARPSGVGFGSAPCG